MVHALSIDVEDWYHDFLVDPRTPRESRVEANTLGVLDILVPCREAFIAALHSVAFGGVASGAIAPSISSTICRTSSAACVCVSCAAGTTVSTS